MTKTKYVVYYDTPNGRPKKDFGADRDEAIVWAAKQPDNRRAQACAITEEVIWPRV